MVLSALPDATQDPSGRNCTQFTTLKLKRKQIEKKTKNIVRDGVRSTVKVNNNVRRKRRRRLEIGRRKCTYVI
jgi:hypothetical protein